MTDQPDAKLRVYPGEQVLIQGSDHPGRPTPLEVYIELLNSSPQLREQYLAMVRRMWGNELADQVPVPYRAQVTVTLPVVYHGQGNRPDDKTVRRQVIEAAQELYGYDIEDPPLEASWYIDP